MPTDAELGAQYRERQRKAAKAQDQKRLTPAQREARQRNAAKATAARKKH